MELERNIGGLRCRFQGSLSLVVMLCLCGGLAASTPALGDRSGLQPVPLVAPGPASRVSSATSLSTPAPALASERAQLVYDALILDFAGYHTGASDVVRVLHERYPDDPLVALIDVEHRFWPQLYDVGVVRDDPELVAAIDAAVTLSKARLDENPEDLTIRALYGRAMLHDARRLALDGYLLRAGSRGEDARVELEAVLEHMPQDDDSRYLLGNYYYWAGVLPAYLKYINWLWFVPRGDRDEGLAMLREASRSSSPYAESAQVMLSVVDSHHAPTDFESAAIRLTMLHTRYPMNILIEHELVDVLFKMGRYDEIEPLLDHMEARQVEPQPVLAYARVTELWRARIALHRRHVDEAARRLDALQVHETELPNWSHAWSDVMQGQIADLRGRRSEAEGHYQSALSREGIYDSERARNMASAGLESPFDPDLFEHPVVVTDD